MDAATLQSKVYAGYGKAALRIGKDINVVTPTSALSPMGGASRIIKCAFSVDSKFSKFNKYGYTPWIAYVDGSHVNVGDYLVSEDGTWFVAAKEHLLPILAVECHRVIDVRRINLDRDIGDVSYMADTSRAETSIMQGWPCSIVQGTKGERNATGLPTDERTPWWSILFPFCPGVIINPSDVVVDDLGRRYAVSSPELTDLGWRLTASLQGA